MHALIADDDPTTALVVARALERRWDLPVQVAHDGEAAWKILSGENPPPLAIVDWMMPGIDGLELCRRVRRSPTGSATYIILLTARDSRADIVAGLEAGADDYLVKPFDSAELGARVQAGIRIVSLQSRLTEQIAELQKTLASVRELKGLLPICSYCKAIRKDEGYWEQLETYISDHSGAEFSHGICPTCLETAKLQFEA